MRAFGLIITLLCLLFWLQNNKQSQQQKNTRNLLGIIKQAKHANNLDISLLQSNIKDKTGYDLSINAIFFLLYKKEISDDNVEKSGLEREIKLEEEEEIKITRPPESIPPPLQ